MRHQKFKPGDLVVSIRLSPNLGNRGEVGRVYKILSIAPKVRITPGTGEYFLHVDGGSHVAAFNLKDVKHL